MSLKAILREKIRRHGPLTVADYMELALGHPEHGYYMHRDPFGAGGDFTTAPEISQVFGEMLGLWCGDLWHKAGEPDIAVVELGPGRGTLMQDFLRATAHIADFHDHLCIVLVETSPKLRRLQQATLYARHPRIGWQPSLDELPRLPSFFLANEFFDALPVRQFVKTPEGLKEKLVDIDPEDNEKFCFIVKELGLKLVKGGKYAGDEAIVESSPASRAVASRIAAHLHAYGGAGLIIDYGYTGGSNGNTLQAVRRHGFHPVLEDPGEADLTAHVDFDALAEVFRESGIATYGPAPQGSFLSRMGAELRAEILMQRADMKQRETIASGIQRLISAAQMGDLFRVLGFVSDATLQPDGFE